MTLLPLIAGSLLAAAPGAATPGGSPGLEERLPGLPLQPEDLGRAPFSPFLTVGTTLAPAPPPRVGLLLLGGAAALAGLALTLPAVTHRGCALAGQCAEGTQSLVAGGLFLVGASLAAAAVGPGTTTGTGSVRLAGLTGAELRERIGLDVPLGAPGPRRILLRWSPFRLQRGGGIRVGVAF